MIKWILANAKHCVTFIQHQPNVLTLVQHFINVMQMFWLGAKVILATIMVTPKWKTFHRTICDKKYLRQTFISHIFSHLKVALVWFTKHLWCQHFLGRALGRWGPFLQFGFSVSAHCKHIMSVITPLLLPKDRN